MSLCVLDASVALNLVMEAAPAPDLSHLLPLLASGGVAVPGIWHWEVVNALVRAERRLDIRVGSIVEAMAALAMIPLQTEPEEPEEATLRLLPLARTERLSVFDAAYLDLAGRTGLPLATLDRSMADAAQRRAITLLPLIP
jgi:predicted nucleic acid-binding protein